MILSLDCKSVEPAALELPAWLPNNVVMYLAHVEFGKSIRGLAKEFGVHPSTVSRSIRKVESRRDDPLIDQAMTQFGHSLSKYPEAKDMTIHTKLTAFTAQAEKFDGETLNTLRRLSEPNTVLALAKGLEIAIIVRDHEDGRMEKLATIDRTEVIAMTMKDWIICDDPTAKIARYKIATMGRAKLRELLELAEENEAQATGNVNTSKRKTARMRYGTAESPILSMARRATKTGERFLDPTLVAVAEKIREDYEVSLINSTPPIEWNVVISTGIYPNGIEDGATLRFARAMVDLGPGLGDVVLNCCCKLHGIEVTEQNMGWSARSGKIVLRIALQRLHRHFEDQGIHQQLVG